MMAEKKVEKMVAQMAVLMVEYLDDKMVAV